MVLKYQENVYFGIECKQPTSKKGEEIGRYIRQAMRYSNYEFEVEPGVFKKIPIFICPPLSYNYFLMNNQSFEYQNGVKLHRDRHGEFDSHHSMNGLLGSFGIGEVRKRYKKGEYFFSFSNKIIFSNGPKHYLSKEIIGLHEKNYESLIKNL